MPKKPVRAWFNFAFNTVNSRGRVEDTRLEAKAKDTKKKSETKDSPSEDRPSSGQGQECSRPRTKDTGASVIQKENNNNKIKVFGRSPPKKGLQKFFSDDLQNFNNSKNAAVFEPRKRQFSRTLGFKTKVKDLTFEAEAKASKCVLEDVLEAKDVLEDSTSVN